MLHLCKQAADWQSMCSDRIGPSLDVIITCLLRCVLADIEFCTHHARFDAIFDTVDHDTLLEGLKYISLSVEQASMEIWIDDIRVWYSVFYDCKTEVIVISSNLDHQYIWTTQRSEPPDYIHQKVIGDSPHQWPGTRKMFPFDDVIMIMGHKVQESFLKITELAHYRWYLTDESFKTAILA